jgi:hypothetical protein
MKPNLTIRLLILAAAVLAAAACQKPAQDSSTASAAVVNGAQTQQAASSSSAPAAPAAPKVQVCKLLSAAEVGAVMGKTLIQDGCTYGLDPAAKEKALAESQKSMKAASNGDMSGLMKGMMPGGGGPPMGNAMSAMRDQMNVSVDASRDDQTEEQVKAIFAKTGATVHGALSGPLAPENHGMTGVIKGLDEVNGVGDWAFATNVASVNMGAGFSLRGRILEARKGPWHVTVSATVGPDPGAAALDARLADVARALIAKL